MKPADVKPVEGAKNVPEMSKKAQERQSRLINNIERKLATYQVCTIIR